MRAALPKVLREHVEMLKCKQIITPEGYRIHFRVLYSSILLTTNGNLLQSHLFVVLVVFLILQQYSMCGSYVFFHMVILA